MALKQIVLAGEIAEKKEQLDQLREKRIALNKRQRELEDEINSAESNEQRAEVDEKIDKFVAERDSNNEEIEEAESELEELQKRMEQKYSRIPQTTVSEEKREQKGDIYREMSGIVLRKNDSLYERRKPEFTDVEKNLSLGKYIRGMVTGRWDNAENERSAMLTSGANSIIPSPLYSRIVDKARDLSIFSSANVPTVVMESNNLTIAKIKEDLIASFKEEGKAAAESSPLELEGITLNSKTIYGYAYVSLEAIESAENLDSILTDSFARSVANGIDKGMLYGVYSGSAYQEYAPAGIFNNTEINTITAASSDYDDVIKAGGRIRANNGVASILAMNANSEETLSLLKTSDGQYLTQPQAVADLKRIVSNQLNHSDEDGDDMLVFDPNALLIGVQQGINIKVFDGDTESIKRGLVCFRVMSMVDCVVLQPKHISRIKGFGKAKV